MYKKSGKKLQDLANLLFWLMFIPFILAGLVVWVEFSNMNNSSGGLVLYLFILGVGFLISWLTNLFMHAFGTLVESTEQILDNAKAQLDELALLEEHVRNLTEYLEVYESPEEAGEQKRETAALPSSGGPEPDAAEDDDPVYS